MADTTVMCYSASFEFFTEENRVQNCIIDFSADDMPEAIRSAVRWWDGRLKHVNEYFNRALCVKVYPKVIGPIGPGGELNTRNGIFWFEWKYDTAGMSLNDYVEMDIERHTRKQ